MAIKTAADIQLLTIKSLLGTKCFISDRPVVVACSGGPDSTALLHMLINSMHVNMDNLIVAHLNHDFRGQEAEDDADFVKNMADKWGVQYRIGRADPLTYQNKHRISSFEQAARELRYTFLRDVARDVGASMVLLGHTQDDLAETILGHIIRGSGLQGLVGMEVCSRWPFPYDENDIVIVRPMLEISKGETEAYCTQLDIPFRRDSGNYSHRFTRNRIRHSLLPDLEMSFNPGIKEALVRLSRIASENLTFIESYVSGYWEAYCTSGIDNDFVRIDLDGYMNASRNIQRLLLRKAYEHILGNTTRLQEVHIDQVIVQIDSGVHRSSQYQIANWPNQIIVTYDCDGIVISRGEYSLRSIPPIVINLNDIKSSKKFMYMDFEYRFEIRDYSETKMKFGSESIVYLDASKVPDTLVIRTMVKGDRFHPFGFDHEIDMIDYCSKRRISKSVREAMPIIADVAGQVWVAGDRIRESGKINSGTQKILQINRVK